jgi:hypothetical protein
MSIKESFLYSLKKDCLLGRLVNGLRCYQCLQGHGSTCDSMDADAPVTCAATYTYCGVGEKKKHHARFFLFVVVPFDFIRKLFSLN